MLQKAAQRAFEDAGDIVQATALLREVLDTIDAGSPTFCRANAALRHGIVENLQMLADAERSREREYGAHRTAQGNNHPNSRSATLGFDTGSTAAGSALLRSEHNEYEHVHQLRQCDLSTAVMTREQFLLRETKKVEVVSRAATDHDARWELCKWTHDHFETEPHRSHAEVDAVRREMESGPGGKKGRRR